MKVKELIEKLKECNPEAEVVTTRYNGGYFGFYHLHSTKELPKGSDCNGYIDDDNWWGDGDYEETPAFTKEGHNKYNMVLV